VNRELGRLLLERCGCEVVTVADGAAALLAASSAAFDLIFLDLQMPVLNGLEAARRIRRAGVRAPLVAMSASVMSQEREQCRRAGMSEFLPKPFRKSEVQELLARLLAGGVRTEAGETAETSGAAEAAEAAASPATAGARTAAEATGPAAAGAKTAAGAANAQRVFEPAQALAACLGDRDTLGRLLAAFVSGLDTQLSAIRQAAASGDAQRVCQEAHAVKGAALNLHAAELAERAAELEEAGRAGRLAEISALLPGLEQARRRFRSVAQV